MRLVQLHAITTAALVAALIGMGCSVSTTNETAPDGDQAATPAKSIIRVEIVSRPGGHGPHSAHRDVFADGKVTGSHASGAADAIRIYQDEDKIEAAHVETIFDQAAAHAKTWPDDANVDQQSSHIQITVHFSDQTTHTAYLPARKDPPTPQAKALLKSLTDLETGAW